MTVQSPYINSDGIYLKLMIMTEFMHETSDIALACIFIAAIIITAVCVWGIGKLFDKEQ